mgnify:CR=1 FL=1
MKRMITYQSMQGKANMINKKSTMLKDKRGNAIIVSLLVTMLVVVVMFSVVGIYMNKMYSIKNLNNYYDKKIIEQLNKGKSSE